MLLGAESVVLGHVTLPAAWRKGLCSQAQPIHRNQHLESLFPVPVEVDADDLVHQRRITTVTLVEWLGGIVLS